LFGAYSEEVYGPIKKILEYIEKIALLVLGVDHNYFLFSMVQKVHERTSW
jgi:hypothetical protein